MATYRGYADELQAPGDRPAGEALPLKVVNPRTGLATDYLNRFNEAIMLLDMLSESADCAEDFLAWRAMGYREHFIASRLRERDRIIAAYDAADPMARDHLDSLADAMIAVIDAARAALLAEPPEAFGRRAGRAARRLKRLLAQAGAVINGGQDGRVPQAAIDRLMED